MRHRRLGFALLLALAGTPGMPPAGQAQQGLPTPCDPRSSTYEQSACLDRALQAADKALNAAYRQAQAAIEGNRDMDAAVRSAWRASLVRTQRAWIAFRDADCGELTGYEWHGGTGSGPATLACLLARTEQRTRELTERYAGR